VACDLHHTEGVAVPVLPSDLPIGAVGTISHTHAMVFLIASMACAGLVLAYAAYELVRRRSALLFYCLAGSLFCNVTEPFWDALGGLRFYDGNIVAYTMFPDLPVPVHYPWWAAFVYTYFTGVATYVFIRMFSANVRRSTFWWFMVGQAVFNTVLEGFVITGAYDYHGNQPWRFISDFPLWWVFANYGAVLAGAVIVAAVRRWGPRAALIALFVVPSSFAAWELWAGWPVYAALNSDLGSVGRNIAALMTAGICIATLWGIREFMTPAEKVAASQEHRSVATPEISAS
jgi:hypothetical protein